MIGEAECTCAQLDGARFDARLDLSKKVGSVMDRLRVQREWPDFRGRLDIAMEDGSTVGLEQLERRFVLEKVRVGSESKPRGAVL